MANKYRRDRGIISEKETDKMTDEPDTSAERKHFRISHFCNQYSFLAADQPEPEQDEESDVEDTSALEGQAETSVAIEKDDTHDQPKSTKASSMFF